MEAIQPLKECLAVWEALRTLGFQAKDIYLLVTPDSVGIEFDAKGERHAILAGKCSLPADEIQRQWLDLAQWWNAVATHAEKEDLWLKSKVGQDPMPLLSALVVKGLMPNRAELN